ncbi:protein phosphatase inhibitor 2 [Carcharodon carcharias]|uniref:protein phosphatase inhibitor 2 n=1 Tax=Carcharodon carcharias TaxID=13397 RepID=UPI001B7EFA31|nr:protein phosphatase inhibitor 2 [Carcharodon carcharias]
MAAPAPIKGILKNRNTAPSQQNSALDLCTEEEEYNKKSQKWDEMNILATYHPEGKDYGLMKIDEPSTPYNRMIEGDDDDEAAMSDSESNVNITAEILAKKLTAAEGINPKIFEPKEESSEEEEELTPEEQENKKQFEMKRKMHYNEGMNIKLARQLIAKELEDDEDDMKGARDLEEDFEDDTDEDLSENEDLDS